MKAQKEYSKFLSLILRHQPEIINIQLTYDGWADIDELIEKSKTKNIFLSHELIKEISDKSDKQRFKISDDRKRIRANQGHSIKVDVGLKKQNPPEILFHGTATRFIESIKEHGLVPGSRQFVHLSKDEETAIKVGARHGKAIVLTIESGKMHHNGFEFFLSENNVWLAKKIPREYINFK